MSRDTYIACVVSAKVNAKRLKTSFPSYLRHSATLAAIVFSAIDRRLIQSLVAAAFVY